MDKNNSILVIGSINMGISLSIKQIPEPWQTLEASSTLFETDGKASRIGAAAANLGAEVSIIGKIGNDSYGTNVLQTLNQIGINTQHVSIIDDTPTGIVTLLRTSKKETSVINSPGANFKFVEGEITKLESFIAQHKIIVLTNKIPIFSTCEALKIAKKYKLIVLFDPSPVSEVPNSVFEDVDIILPNESDIRYSANIDTIDLKYARLALSHYMEMGVKKAAILKIGADAALIKSQNEFISIGSIDMTDNEIDQKGDKDIFTAALAVSISQNNNLYQSTVYAKVAAQLSDMQSGVRAIMPIKESLQDYLNKNPLFQEITSYK